MARGVVGVCPDCGGTRLSERTELSPRYRCDDCGAEFAEPVARPNQRIAVEIPADAAEDPTGNPWEDVGGQA